MRHVNVCTYKIRHEETHQALIKSIKDCDPEHGRNITLQQKGHFPVSYEYTSLC